MTALAGRDEDLAVMADVRSRVRREGTAYGVVLDGPAGIGKSAILAEAVADAEDDGWRVVQGGITQAESSLPWAGLAVLWRSLPEGCTDALTAAQRAAVRGALGLEDAEGSGEVESVLVGSGLAAALRAMVDDAPLLVAIDDLHWLDAATAGVLSFAIRSLATRPAAFVVATRPGRVPLTLDRLLPAGRVEHRLVEGLAIGDVQGLLTNRFGLRIHGTELTRLHAVTGGNPLHAVEVGRLVAAGRTVQDAVVPPTLQAIVDEHLGGLDAAVVDLLAHIALLVSPTTARIERALPGAAELLVVAEDAGVIGVRGDAVTFAHPLLRAGVLDRLGTLRRRRIERRLAEVADDDEARVHHLAAAADAPDEELAARLASWARSALVRGVPAIAFERACRAIELSPAGAAGLVDLHLCAGEAAMRLMEYDHVRHHYEAAIALDPPPAQLAEALRGTSVAIGNLIDPPAAADALEPWLDRLAPDSREHRDLLALSGALTLFSDLRRAEPITSAVVARTGPGDGAAGLDAVLTAASVRLLRGLPVDLDAVERLTDDAVLRSSATAGLAAAEVLTWSDRTAVAAALVQELLERATADGHVGNMLNALAGLLECTQRRGELDAAEAVIAQSIALRELTGIDPSSIGTFADVAWQHAVRGRSSDAQAAAAATLAATKTIPAWHLQSLVRLGFVDLVRGDVEQAAASLRDARRVADDYGLEDPGVLPFRADLVDVLVAVGALDEAEAECALLREHAARAGRPLGRAEAGRAVAILAGATGRFDEAEAGFLDAMDAHDGLVSPFERGRALLAGGAVARRAGRRLDARARLTEALAVFREIGSPPFVARAEADLARVGIRPGQQGELTPSEREVVRAVLAGRSNPEVAAELFISVRTVESNLTRAYRKLGVRSRVELLARRDSLDV